MNSSSHLPTNFALLEERAKASFCVENLTYFLEGDPDKTRRRRELGKLLTFLSLELVFEQKAIRCKWMTMKVLIRLS